MKYRQSAILLVADFSVKDFSVTDMWTGTQSFSKIIQSQGHSANAISINFTADESFKKCPFHLKIEVQKALEITANLLIVNEVSRTMALALQNEKIDLSFMVKKIILYIFALQKKAKETAKKQMDDLKAGQYQHQGFSVEADIFAPQVVIPGDIFLEDQSRILKVNFGRIKVNSDLQEYVKGTDYMAY